MSPLLRKEIRLLLPFWGIALALAVVPVFATPLHDWWRVDDTCFWLFGFGLTLLGLAPFGQEFGWGTFSIMLAQPIERRRIWKTKLLLLLAAGAVVFVAFAICIHVQLVANLRAEAQRMLDINQISAAQAAVLKGAHPSEFDSAVMRSFALLLTVLTGGLWTTLLFRQTGAALWFTILIPGVLIVIMEGIFHASSNAVMEIAVDLVLVFYAFAGFAGARRMFARAQDSQWLGETIAVMSLKSTKVHDDSAAPRRKAAIRALVRKEFQSHQISLLIAFGLLVLHICTLIFRHFYVMPRSSEFRFAVEAVPLLWLLIPWLMGCVAIAEERKLGTMEGQLCLPVNRRTQFAIKLIVVFVLGTIVGGGMPALLESLGTLAGIHSGLVTSTSGNGIYLFTLAEFVIGAGLIALVSLFASSLTRNTLHALGAAVLFGVAWVLLINWVTRQSVDTYEYSLWKGPLIRYVGAPICLLTVIALSFSNYKTLHAGRRVWMRTLAVLCFTVVATGVAVAFVYQRPWELMLSLEPQHGSALVSGSVRPVVCMPNGRLCVLLRDGRIWIAADYHVKELDYDEAFWNGGEVVTKRAQIDVPDSGTFVGSNWVALAASDNGGDVDALRSDGTLWRILSYIDRTNTGTRVKWIDLKPNPQRIGADSDWKAIVSVEVGFLAIKSNGTLWGWAQNPDGQFSKARGMYEPTRMGTDSDWETIFPQANGALLRKRDETMWTMVGMAAYPGVDYARLNLNGADWREVYGQHDYRLVIKRDGSLWEWRMRGYDAFGFHGTGEQNPYAMTRLGNDADWMQLTGFPLDLVAVKGGRLVKNGKTPFAASLGRPSKYSDWIAADAWYNSLVALAADGTLTMWNEQDLSGSFRLLGPSRRPVWSLNVMAGAKD